MNSPFDNFIQEMLGNRNPQGNMLTGVSTTPNFYNQAQNNDYYNNPFRRQDSIDAAMAKKLADEQALAQQLGLSNADGMMSSGGDSPETQLTADQIAYFDEETLDEQGARIKNDLGWLVKPIAGLLGGPIGYGLTKGVNTSSDFNGPIRTPDAIRQQIQLQQSLMADEQRKREAAQVAMAAEANRAAAINAQAASRMRRQEGVGGGGGGESNMSYGGSTGSNVGTSNPNSYSSSRSSGS